MKLEWDNTVIKIEQSLKDKIKQSLAKVQGVSSAVITLSSSKIEFLLRGNIFLDKEIDFLNFRGINVKDGIHEARLEKEVSIAFSTSAKNNISNKIVWATFFSINSPEELSDIISICNNGIEEIVFLVNANYQK